MKVESGLLLDVPEQIQSDRLLLRCPRGGDGETIFPSVQESFAELKPWMPWATDDYDVTGAEEWCRTSAGKFVLREHLHFLIFCKGSDGVVGAHLGNIGAFKFNWTVPSCEIGYWLRTSQTGKGFMTEAVNALSAMCFEQLKMSRIEITCDDINRRSARVAELCGYTLDGILRHNRRGALDGQLHDTRIYSKLASA